MDRRTLRCLAQFRVPEKEVVGYGNSLNIRILLAHNIQFAYSVLRFLKEIAPATLINE